MASHKQVSVFILSSCVLLGLCMVSQSQASSSDGAVNKVKASSQTYDSGDKVNLLLYYEALCPFCANFIVNQLVKIFQTDLISIVNLRLVPWGNTVIAANNSWLCQHGPDECLLNTVDACAINVWPNLGTHFKFIQCIEHLHLENRHTRWQSCFGTLSLSPTPIRNCISSGLGIRVRFLHAKLLWPS
ncbi:unnamed protein product [Ilex paraguariensis]|uniref:Gamma-interferon-inducible lysosomal thiol reductase n=1 Tax=Ilex paraguariensis TaxID=185542 RepID=A0ABC8UQ55_9AQUA